MEQDMEEELSFHRDMARLHENPIPLGNVEVLKEQGRDYWRFNFIENVWRDLVYATKNLRRSPGFVATALLSLALGIGVNTAMFSLAVEFLLSEPSVRDGASLVRIRLGGSSHMNPAALSFLNESGPFDGVAGEFEESYINWDDGKETHRTFAVQGTRNYFTVLGVPLAYGRGWNETDSPEVVVLSHLFWRKHFAGDPAVVGRGMRLNGRMYTVVGILPAKHRTLIGYGFSPDLYVPQFLDTTVFAAYGRLRHGMSVAETALALKPVLQSLDHKMPKSWKYSSRIEVLPVGGLERLQQESKGMTIAAFFLFLLVLVGLVLLIACVNVASLLLARASARRQEIAIRLSLGASRGRLLQQLLSESLLLSVIGAIAGFLVAQIVARSLAAIELPIPLPVHLHIEPDWRVLSYAAVLAIVSTLLTGLLPAWQSAKESIRADLQRERKLRLRRGMVAAQLGVSLIVLATGSLFLRNLLQSTAISPGFDFRHTVRADVHLPPLEYQTQDRLNPYFDRALQELRAIPGIEAAAAARIIPFTDSISRGTELTFSDTGEKQRVQFHWNAVSSDFFRAMNIPILGGRSFSTTERGPGKDVIVNKTFVEQYAGKRSPIGSTFRWEDDGELYRIIGVVENTKNLTIGEGEKPQLYEELSKIPGSRPRIQFVVRSAIPPALQLGPVREALRRIEPSAGIEVSTMYTSIGLAFLPSQVGAVLMGGVGVLGLLLAAIGLYGVMAYSVARRTREIGIRLAIGASRRSISRIVLRESMKMLVLGAIPGLLIALFVTRPLAMFLVPGLSPSDPVSFLMVVLILVLTGLLASLGPLRRAVGVDPARCLRYE